MLGSLLAACSVLPEYGVPPKYEEPPATTYTPAAWDLASGSFSEKIEGAAVSAEFFPASKALPYVGRFFRDEDHAPGAIGVVVLSHDLWQRRFDSRPEVIGRQIRLNGQALTIIGIAPPGFGFPGRAALWTPRA